MLRMNNNTLRKIATVFTSSIGGVVLLSNSLVGASGLTPNQLEVLNQGIYFYNTEISSCSTSPSDSTTLTGSDNIEKAYNFFIGKGLGPIQAAGIVGNFWWESHGVNPSIEQTPGSWQDTQTSPNPPYPDYNHAVGIAQWDGGRRVAIINEAAKEVKSPQDLAFQLNYSWGELSGPYNTVLNNLRSTSDVTSATMIFGRGYEAPLESAAHWSDRINEAKTIYDKYGGGSGGNGSSCGVTCDPSGNTATGNLSSIRQNVVCIAKGELETAWTPLPPAPRTLYSKYSDGWLCNGGQQPVNNSCGKGGNEEWCADFTSWVYRQAGDHFVSVPGQDLINGYRYTAVGEIEAMGKANQQFHWHDANGYSPVPGDLAIHSYGHVNIVISVNGNHIQFIGGDQGSGPYGGPQTASVVSEVSYNDGSTSDSTIGYVSPD